MRYIYLLSTFLVSVALVACASSERGATGEKFSFKTGSIPANFSITDGALADPSEVYYLVFSHCRGVNCKPEEAKLAFNLHTGANTAYLSNRNLVIKAGNKNYKWMGHEWTDIYSSPPVNGNIKTVTLTYEELQKIATSQEVTGTLSGHSFEWSFENREPIRAMLAQIESHRSK